MNATDRANRSGRSEMGVRRATGRGYAEWFEALDAWGAPGRPYREMADWLTGTHGMSDWWAQKLIVEYEEARGLRPPGIRRDGTFEVGATETVAVPVSRLFAAFVDADLRERWLPGARLRQRVTHPTARCDSTGTTVRAGSSPASAPSARPRARWQSSTRACPMRRPRQR